MREEIRVLRGEMCIMKSRRGQEQNLGKHHTTQEQGEERHLTRNERGSLRLKPVKNRAMNPKPR